MASRGPASLAASMGLTAFGIGGAAEGVLHFPSQTVFPVPVARREMEWDKPFHACPARHGFGLSGGQVTLARRDFLVLVKKDGFNEKSVSVASQLDEGVRSCRGFHLAAAHPRGGGSYPPR
jgi:hypothetical protein